MSFTDINPDLSDYFTTSEYKDIRSGEKAENRRRKRFQKYYGFRGVKPSWVGQQFYSIPDDTAKLYDPFLPQYVAPLLTHPQTVQVKTWTKRDQYVNRAHGVWPLDVQHKVGRRHRRCCCYLPSRRESERSGKGIGRLRHEVVDQEQMHWEIERGYTYVCFCAMCAPTAFPDIVLATRAALKRGEIPVQWYEEEEDTWDEKIEEEETALDKETEEKEMIPRTTSWSDDENNDDDLVIVMSVIDSDFEFVSDSDVEDMWEMVSLG